MGNLLRDHSYKVPTYLSTEDVENVSIKIYLATIRSYRQEDVRIPCGRQAAWTIT